MQAAAKPLIAAVAYAQARRWSGAGHLIQEKSDGSHSFHDFEGLVLNTELMRDGSRVVNDFVSDEPTRLRWRELVRIFANGPIKGMRLCRTGCGGEFIEAEAQRSTGGDVVVAKNWETGFGIGWLKVKLAVPYYVRVAGLQAFTGAVLMRDVQTGEDRGLMPLRGNKFEQVRVGSILKVVATAVHKSGKLREARPDADSPTSWLVQF